MSSSPTTTTSGPPAYAAPYFDRALNRAEGLSQTPYQAYTGQRVAGTSPLEQMAFDQSAGMGQPAVYGQAANLFGQAGLGQSSYTAGGLGDQYTSRDYNPAYSAGQISNQLYNPSSFNASYTGPDAALSRMGNYQANGIAANYNPGQFTEGKFGAADAQEYMNPYQQGVTDIAKREADRTFEKQQTAQRLQAAQRGAFGGSRATLLETEAQRNQNQLLNDIQTKGLQDAYLNAQGQYNTERNRQLQVEQAREQANQFGGNLGLQAQTQNEAARLAGSQLGLQALTQQEQARQAASTQSLDAQRLADQSKLQSGQMSLQQFQANEAARQAGGQAAQQANQLTEQSRQFNAQDALSQYQQYQQALQQQAQLGFTANGQRIQAAQGLASLGAQQQQSELNRINQLAQLGTQQRALSQAELDAAYQEFLNARNDPQQKLGNFISAISGSPGSTTTTPAPSLLSQLGGAGLSAAAIYQMLNTPAK